MRKNLKEKTKAAQAAHLFAMPGKRLYILMACVAVAIVVAVSYCNSFTGAFFFDNSAIIVESEILPKDDMVGTIFSTNYWEPVPSDLYRPLTIYTYYLNYKVWGGGQNPVGYHVFNFALHLLNGLLVLFLLSKITGRILVGTFSALLFAAHPVATEAVTNVVGRADLLAMFFVLAAFLLHLAGGALPRSKGMPLFALGAVLLALGLLSKENTVAAVGLFAAFDIIVLWPKVRGSQAVRGFWRWLLARLYTCHVFYLAVVVGWLILRRIVLGSLPPALPGFIESPLIYVSFLQREATAVVMLGLYLFRIVWPVTLSADYSYNQIPFVTSLADIRFLASLTALLALMAAGALLWKKSPLASFFIWFFFIAVAPVSNIFLAIGTIGAERLLYMPFLGWCACLSLGLFRLGGFLPARLSARILVPAVALICITGLYSYRTLLRNEDWRTAAGFWEATYAASPDSVKAINGYAQALKAKDPQKAKEMLERSFRISEEYLYAYLTYSLVCMDLGAGLKDAGDAEGARRIYRDGYNRLERYLTADHEHLTQMKKFMVKMGLDPAKLTLSGREKVFFNLGTLSELTAATYPPGEERMPHLEKAVGHYRDTVYLDTADWQAGIRLGSAYLDMARMQPQAGSARQEMLDLAAISFVRAIIVSDRAEDAWARLGTAYREMGHDPNRYIETTDAGRRYDFKNDEGARDLNVKYLKLGVRSLMMLELSRVRPGSRERAIQAAKGAAYRYRVRVPLEETMPLLSEKFSPDDERIWSGK